MRLLLILTVLLLSTKSYTQDIVDIPDPNFKQALIEEGVDTNGDGEIQVNEAEAVEWLVLEKPTVLNNLIGINSFVNLQSLELGDLVYIENLDIMGLEALTSLFIENKSGLKNLKLKYLPSIKILHIYGFTNLEILNLTNLSNLNELLIEENSSLKNLELNNLGLLWKIDILGNDELVELDLSGLLALTKIKIEGNDKLLSINSIGLSAITELNIIKNDELINLDLNHLSSLNTLNISENNRLLSLDLNGLSSLTTLNISGNNGLLSIDLNGLSSLTSLNINNYEGSIKNFNISALPFLKDFIFSDNNGPTNLNLSELQFLKNLIIQNNKNLKIIEFSNVPKLSKLEIIDNIDIISLDVSGMLRLTDLNIYSNISLANLNITNLPLLNQLNIIDNPSLTKLDLSGIISSNIQSLWISGNDGLQILDISGLTSLINVRIAFNLNLESINLTGLILLSDLSISGNDKLESFELNDLSSLLTLAIDNNEGLKTFYLNNLTSLYQLMIINNENLENLYFSNLTKVWRIVFLSNIRCKNLDLSGFVSLSYPEIAYNYELEYLYLKNGKSENIILNDNFLLKYICSDEEDISTILHLLENDNINDCTVNSYCPYTVEGNPYQVSGKVIFDFDKNGCNENDVKYEFPKMHISDTQGEGIVFGDVEGDYLIHLNKNTYTITPHLENLDYFKIIPESITLTFPDSTSPYIQDFCIVPDVEYTDLDVVIIPLNQARPGFVSDYKVRVRNIGNTIVPCELFFVYESERMDFLTASPGQDSINGGELYWNLGELKPFELKEILLSFELNTPTDNPPLLGGDVLHFFAAIYSSLRKANRNDYDFYNLYQTVVNSYDPNDKTCLEGDKLLPEMVGDYVHYMIRFENTGTAEAVNIVVRDSIDPARFDISTLQIVDASHELETRINDGNIVEFIFKDIYLPYEDDTNDGYVVFKIKTKDDLVIGDIFENQADIFFDYNAPIITNLASTEVAEFSATHDIKENIMLSLQPNPTANHL
ncbi:MAG: hypothetical protein KDC16_11965, partial [Saprospiraceae bacterium]|nr:hypothetical protein [Saprospiraceae bacterium]